MENDEKVMNKPEFKEEIAELSQIIENLDSKKKGTRKKSGTTKIRTERVSGSENIEILFVKYDRYKNGWLNYDEFQKLLFDYSKGEELTPEQKDRCFVYVNKSESGRITIEELNESLAKLKEFNYTPKISEELLKLMQTQPVAEEQSDNNAEMLKVGWDMLGTVIDSQDPKEDYDFISVTGNGTFSQVHKCIEKATGKTVAIKVIDIAEAGDDIYDLQNEMLFQMSCRHPNICQYYKSYICGSLLYVVVEYVGGGSLVELMSAGIFSEEEIKVIVRQIATTLAFLHARDLVHRDIKAENLMLSETGDIKLIDFRVSSALADIHSTFAGTPLWIAPEVILEVQYNEKVDVWALGITCIELAHRNPPYHDLNIMQALTNIPLNPPPQLEGDFSATFKDFVSFCLTKDYSTRPSALELLTHPFLTRQKFEPSLFGIIERYQEFKTNEDRGWTPSVSSIRLLRFRSVRREKPPTVDGPPAEFQLAVKMPLVRKPTGISQQLPPKLKQRLEKEKDEKANKEKEREKEKEKLEKLKEMVGRQKEKEKEKKEKKDWEREEKKEKKNSRLSMIEITDDKKGEKKEEKREKKEERKKRKRKRRKKRRRKKRKRKRKNPHLSSQKRRKRRKKKGTRKRSQWNSRWLCWITRFPLQNPRWIGRRRRRKRKR